MKSNYTPLSNLTEKSKGFKVKVKVIQKGEPRQTPPKRRYQRLMLRDDEGNTMRGTIFGDDIDMFAEAIQRNGEYELSNVTIKPVPEEFRDRAGNYQINFNERVRIKPLNLSSCSDEPQYRTLSDVPRSQTDDDELIDIAAVVLYVGDVRTVKRGDNEDKVRDIMLADHSICRPLKLSAWNEYADNDSSFLKVWSEGFNVIGFTGIRPITYQGQTLVTTLSTTFVHKPVGDKADKVRAWVQENKPMLENWRTKSILLNSPEKVVVPIADIAKKKASAIWQDEKFWIRASLSQLIERDVYCYVGCSMCGRSVTDNLGTKFVCPNCKSNNAISSARTLMNVIASDVSGSLKVTAFTPEVELVFGMKSEQITTLKTNEEPEPFAQVLDQIRKKEMLLQISPTNALSVSNTLKWTIRTVEVPPEEE